MADGLLCSHVTGTSALPVSPSGRRIGDRRPSGRYDVLCPRDARWLIGADGEVGVPSCSDHLTAIADTIGADRPVMFLHPVTDSARPSGRAASTTGRNTP